MSTPPYTIVRMGQTISRISGPGAEKIVHPVLANEWCDFANAVDAAARPKELTATDNLTISRSDADRIRELLVEINTSGPMNRKREDCVDEIRKLIPNPDA